ncbi:MAG: DUF937 domain-containing protein [Gammaproteobacteria bacterium]|nr:DUF937 domain-containing protein [Gammaproteobacteria bacterium]
MNKARGFSPAGLSVRDRLRRGPEGARGQGRLTPIDTSNLLGLVESCLDEAVLRHVAATLGRGLPQARQAVDAVLPPLLVGLVGAASRPAEKDRIAAAFAGVDEALLEGLDAALTEARVATTRGIGADALRRLFGESGTARLIARAARYAHLDIAATRALLELLAPIAFAAAQRLLRTRGFGPDGLETLLAPGPASPTLPTTGPLVVPCETPAAEQTNRRPAAKSFVPGLTAVAMALAWALLLGYWTLSFAPAVVRQTPGTDPAASSSLTLTNIGSQVEYSGVVDGERNRARILEVLTGVFGESNLVGDVRVDARVPSPRWLAPLQSVVLAARQPGLELKLVGDRIDVAAGRLADGARMVHRLRALFGDRFTVGLRNRWPSPSALAELASGSAFEDLMTLMSVWVIHFPPDSDETPAEHRPLIRRAARLMDALPEGVVVEVSGHTDDTGDAAVNLTLSRVRAESVREALIDAGANPSRVRVRGYGSERPVAGNDRPEGRSLNRRIEFLVVYD